MSLLFFWLGHRDHFQLKVSPTPSLNVRNQRSATTVHTHPHAEDQEADLLHQWVLSDLLFPFLLRGERVVAPLAQLHIHDARLDEASSHILQFQVQV